MNTVVCWFVHGDFKLLILLVFVDYLVDFSVYISLIGFIDSSQIMLNTVAFLLICCLYGGYVLSCQYLFNSMGRSNGRQNKYNVWLDDNVDGDGNDNKNDKINK
ncbi:hypothetical protein DERF_004004 [Dermatophagoides farinae]|uniref:Uncharacterized protein n=1 Tax=Dermatophagoides farinae TaxID=6954 RepID=A0A922IEV7_DERFA|nr:hypothetical protein DERF_004004 [Dermatophagoides farinae]